MCLAINRIKITFVFTVITFACQSQVLAESGVSEFINFLPSGVETIIAVNNPEKIKAKSKKHLFNLVLPIYPGINIMNVDLPDEKPTISSSSVACMLQSCQRIKESEYESPRFHMSSIYKLKPGQAPILFESLSRKADRSHRIYGIDVWKSNIDTTESKGTYFTFLDDLLVISTKGSLANEMVSNILSGKMNKVTTNWQEIKNIDLSSEYFAVRHYSKSNSVKYWSETDMAFVNDEYVTGLSIVPESNKWTKARVLYFSKNPSMFQSYLRSVTGAPIHPTKKSFEFNLVSKSPNCNVYDLYSPSEDARANLFIVFSWLLGFLPI